MAPGETGVRGNAIALASQVRLRPVDDAHVTALIPAAGRTHEITLTVAPSGALET